MAKERPREHGLKMSQKVNLKTLSVHIALWYPSPSEEPGFPAPTLKEL